MTNALTEQKSLFVNDELRTIPASFNLQNALDHWQLTQNSFAVAINEKFVPKTAYQQTDLYDEVTVLNCLFQCKVVDDDCGMRSASVAIS